ncbi:helix-turn-helix domain-containing protein [Gluconobacter oxydans]|uniref:helix-turn-helix domain-containing protein n=1 Tax=Gluconobacter oxydans TaxID=442 RepID=UPI0039EAE7E4
MPADISSTQVHQPHPCNLAGTALRYPYSRSFSGGLQASAFLVAQAGGLKGYFDEPGLTTRCTIILSGACSMRIGGRTQHFQARDLVLAPTSAETFTFENSADFSALELHVPQGILDQMNIAPPAGLRSRFLGCQEPGLQTARQLLGYLRATSSSPATATSPHVLVGYGLAITTLGYAFSEDGQDHRSKGVDKTATGLEAARQVLLERFDKVPTIPQLAALCGLSPTRFKELFRQQFGCAPYAFYQAHRMEYARQLLCRKNVTETAMQLGYSNISHFSAAFQRQFGCTPSQWQRQIR